ncbi:hypothetical protein M378DRAFT_168079 [Amanita muscaria Koide BX008]|uniref:Uncharacterized protein n=1 Tax=Amanita muscaria (strain Koide BX008) TaxID=946122 RepID=A0A0C2T1Y5_AMAMK|nr:hypothetical protein M378DRAFT_168079 [Amanita muscaria Koide BX008]
MEKRETAARLQQQVTFGCDYWTIQLIVTYQSQEEFNEKSLAEAAQEAFSKSR